MHRRILGARTRAATIAVTVCALVLSLGIAIPAMAGPQAHVAASATGTAKKALKIAKRADKRSRLALKAANGSGSNGNAGQPGQNGTKGGTGQTGPQGPKGDKGDPGLKGDKGDTGAPGATNVVARVATQPNIANNTQSTDSSFCQPGERLVGGGAGFVNPANGAYDFPATLHGSVPVGSDGKPVADGAAPAGWRASALNTTGATRSFKVVALCATP